MGQPHNETGVKIAGKILEEIKYPQERIQKITRIIMDHPLDFKNKLETSEEKMVWDADKIDLLGAVGVARVFTGMPRNHLKPW